MHFSVIKLVVITLGSAFFAALAMLRRAFMTGEDPSDDGPRALIAQYLGLWSGLFLFFWSFTVQGKTPQWSLRGLAAVMALVGLGLSIHFANTTEGPEPPDKGPTGFKNNSTDLHLE